MRRRAVLLSLFLTGFAACHPGGKGQSALYESVVLVTIDTLRADHLSCYGYPVHTSPCIDGLASKGALFEQAFSASSTTASSHVSILTGRFPSAHSVGAYNFGVLSLETVTLQEILKRRGFKTTAIVSNPTLDRSLGLDQGFDKYDDDIGGTEASREFKGQRADIAVDKAIRELGKAGTHPFFLWLHLQDPHGPYSPPEKILESRPGDYPLPDVSLPLGPDQSGYGAIPLYQDWDGSRSRNDYIRRYDEEIRYADHELLRLTEYLETQKRSSRTLLIITSDHGESFGEDNFYFSHSHSIGYDQVHVPLLLVGSGIAAGTRIADPISNVWIFPTVIAALGIGEPDTKSRSLLDIVRGRGIAPLPPFFIESLSQIGMVYKDTFVRRDRMPENDKAFWEYGNPNTMSYWRPLGNERIGELHGARSKSPDVEDSLGQLLSEYQRQAPPATNRAERERRRSILSEKYAERLRSLGYIK